MNKPIDGQRAGCKAARMMKRAFAVLAAVSAAGCVQIKAPEKPIEINLNVNIRHDVVVSLREDVRDLDQKYPGVF